MQFANATNFDRKSGVRGTKKTGRSPTIALAYRRRSKWPVLPLRPPLSVLGDKAQ